MRKLFTHRLLLILITCALFCTPLFNAQAAMEIAWNVQDPRLREAVYDLHEGDYFSGIIRLVTNRNFVDVGAEKDNVNLLLAALYISYGMPDEAKEILSEELDNNSKPDIGNALWLKLAESRFQRNQTQDASAALAQIQGKMSKETEIERRLLYALVLIQQNQAKKAAEVISVIDLKGNAPSTAFVRYNLAVALLKLNRTGEAIDHLKLLSELNTNQRDLLALKDQALIAAGYTLLRTKDATKAKDYLEQVRPDGVLSGRALLGLGWAYSIMDKHKFAIAAWSELEKRDLSDPAAMEAALAVSYGFSKLEAYRQAAEHYEASVNRFLEADQKLEGLIQGIRSGKTMKVILRHGPMAQASAMQEYRRVTDPTELNFLAPFLMSHEFQQAHRNYEDTQTLGKKIQQWITALEKAKVSSSFRESYMGRLVKHQIQITNTLRDLEKYLKRLILSRLTQQKEQISSNVAQARFAMAQIYDQAARTNGE